MIFDSKPTSTIFHVKTFWMCKQISENFILTVYIYICLTCFITLNDKKTNHRLAESLKKAQWIWCSDHLRTSSSFVISSNQNTYLISWRQRDELFHIKDYLWFGACGSFSFYNQHSHIHRMVWPLSKANVVVTLWIQISTRNLS